MSRLNIRSFQIQPESFQEIYSGISSSVFMQSKVQKPEVLTPEVMVFFGLLAFLAVFGNRGGK